ncbi:MAG: cytochrome c peroxidase [Chloroflexota bacterium]|nr:cytochrome c peroxidase [Chloroflexota bacterium]
MAVTAAVVLMAGCGPPSPIPPEPPPEATVSEEPILLPTAAPSPTPAAAWPPPEGAVKNPPTAEKIELGRQLFFEPILSDSGGMSCATCHRPELGFSNGQPVSPARPGAPPRNVSTLWNTGFNRFLLWDGRESSLEEHARLPLTLPHEMASDPDRIVATLQGIPAYVQMFNTVFGGTEPISFENTTRALAAFQRSLISDTSPYDRFVAGEKSSLTPEQQRGMALFFSQRTNCSECHQPPTFAMETFRVVGVNSEDPGRAAVHERGLYGAFKVPTLRNIARTAPYMHDGSFAALENVVDFYAAGAGRAHDFPNVDPLLKGFDLDEQDRADLVAFLTALTDESGLPDVPERALSGLPVIAPVDQK